MRMSMRADGSRRARSAIVFFISVLIWSSLIAGTQLIAQTQDTTQTWLDPSTNYQTPGAEYTVEPYVCWTTIMEFYDPQAHPYYNYQGYFFDANPFRLYRWLEGNTAGMFRSTKGYDLVDVTGLYVWKDNRVKVNCYIRRYWWGYNQPYAVVSAEFGPLERRPSSGGGGADQPNDHAYREIDGVWYECQMQYLDDGSRVESCTAM
jgi:hypothetical protein